MPKHAKNDSSIFDKLTDTSQYTGTHVHRFDATGYVSFHHPHPIPNPRLPFAVTIAQFIPTVTVIAIAIAIAIASPFATVTANCISLYHPRSEYRKGRGLKGRDRIPKGTGTSDIPYTGGPILDIAQVMRPNLRLPKEKQSYKPIPIMKNVITRTRCKEAGCNNLSGPNSKWGLCSFHMVSHFDINCAAYSTKTSPSPSPCIHLCPCPSLPSCTRPCL